MRMLLALEFVDQNEFLDRIEVASSRAKHLRLCVLSEASYLIRSAVVFSLDC